MPGRSGLELISEVKRLKPATSILILSIYPEEQYALRALKLGAMGYLTKSSAPEELIDAVVKTARRYPLYYCLSCRQDNTGLYN